MFLVCRCLKMYRVRDKAKAIPTKCPACGGPLRPASAAELPSSTAPDPYRTLGIPRTATREEIRDAYAWLATVFDPTTYPDQKIAAAVTGMIRDAYQALIR